MDAVTALSRHFDNEIEHTKRCYSRSCARYRKLAEIALLDARLAAGL